MNETYRTTLSFVGVAAVLLALAVWVSLPPDDVQLSDVTNKPLYAEFDDPKEAASLEIVKVDEEKGELKRFQVRRSADGRWVIPSHGDYPADATDQMRDAATSLVNLNVIGIASEEAGDHEMFGVVEPDEKRLEAGAKGFGMLVAFEDRKGEDLARLIVGKRVEGSENQRFVRKSGQDPVYVVELPVDQLSTDFGDWIEKDLLKISPWDIDRATIKDYQFIVAQGGTDGFTFQFDPRLEMTVGWDEDANTWTLDKMIQYQRGRPVATALNSEEELNKDKLDAMKSALDNLQIVDVQRKPKGLGGDLSVDEEAFKNTELRESLQALGFLPATLNKKREFLGTNGEINVGMKDGVEYVLRFGNSAGTEDGNPNSVRRYLFVSARLDESRLKPPVLEPLPDPPATGSSGDDEVTGDKPTDEAQADADKPADDAAPADDAKSDETKSDESKSDEETKPAESEFDLKRKRIEKENQRKLDEYRERRKKAENKVRELNARFAPWYYVISNEEFKKIHLTRADVVREKTGDQSQGFGIDAFRELEKQGIEPPPAQPPSNPGLQGLPPGLNLQQ